jgi:small-conductance mechanosensitive channel
MRRILLPIAILVLATATLPARAASEPPADVAARIAQVRALLASPQGAAILDLLGDPRVRQALLQSPDPASGAAPLPANAGQMMDTMLGSIRARLWRMTAELGNLPTALEQTWGGMREQLPLPELFRLVGALIVFLAGGIGAQWLFYSFSRPWRAHFSVLALTTARDRARAVRERALFGTLLIGAFAAGSMGAFLLFVWPPLTGSIILGYLFASLLTRLSLTATRFFLAPGAERLRLVRVDTPTAWFWHRWLAWLIGVAAVGWQTILMFRSFGMPPIDQAVLLELLLLLLTVLGIVVAWAMPSGGDHAGAARGPVRRLLLSLGLALVWLLFFMGASRLAWTLLILAAVPVVICMFSQSIASVVLGQCPAASERSPYLAIAERSTQAIVVVLVAAALLRIWQIDLTAMSAMDTPMTRVARGLLEALVILVIADLLWQVVRVLIDSRLAGDRLAIDDLDDDERRRRARLYTLLPVLRNFALFIVLVMASLSALAAMGLQIGPLLAGAGVIGIAVGFGAQTLVRDIISGVFFLLDDAFRVGEYIESGGIRGTVESFSLRSVKLRHIDGQLHTVPFGDLKAITNYSRDWVAESLHFVVTYETDLDLLDEVVQMVSDDMMADPVIASELIDPLRSLGVQAMTDTGMQIGLIFKTRPGRQFGIRRAVLSRIKQAFAMRGVRFAAQPQPLTGIAAATVLGS